MLKQLEVPQREMDLVTIESPVPSGHMLRRIDAGIDLDFIREQVRRRSGIWCGVVRSHVRRISVFLRPLSALLLGLLVFQGCNSLNPLCGSARPSPSIGALSSSTITFAEVQQGIVLTVYGSQFVSSSVGAINGTTVKTLVTSSTTLQVTITTAVISAPGTASVTVNTPSGNTGDVGCTSGGTSSALELTIT